MHTQILTELHVEKLKYEKHLGIQIRGDLNV